MKTTIAIIGHTGMVGNAVKAYYEGKDHEVIGRSLDNETKDFSKKLAKAKYCFVCVPTPFDWKKRSYDTAALLDVLAWLRGYQYEGAVIIKSTVLPGVTEQLQQMFPGLQLYFNPEFLSEATAAEDFAKPSRQILGYTKKVGEDAAKVMKILPKAKYTSAMPATAAEIIKYVNNMYGAMMVTFGNFVFELCQHQDVNFSTVKEAANQSEFVKDGIATYWDVKRGGYRGYGGACFPKDMQSLYKFCQEMGYPHELLKGIVAANERVLRDQGLTERQVESKARHDNG